MRANHFFGIAAIALLGLLLRVWGLGAVNQVIFDEVHFGKFVSSYCCTHERFFDIHPPVGKLFIAGGAYLAGGTNGFDFDHIGQPYENVSVAFLRMVPALFGALLPIIIIILLRQMGVSWSISFLGGFAIALENALIVESRLIITDSILLAATFGSLACAFAAGNARKASFAWLLMAGAGILCGIAVGTKFTGLLALGLVGLIALSHAYQSPRNAAAWIGRITLAALAAALVYLAGWYMHFNLLTEPGTGDVWGVPTGIFWDDVTAVHQQMLSANYNLTADHPYGSKWWTWPFMVRSVFYWQGEGNAFIYLLGNPIVWWGAFLGLCACVMTLLFRARQSGWIWIIVLGYFLSYIPLMRVPRVLFLYHYMTPLIFSLLCALWWLDRAVPKKTLVCILFGIAIAAGFLFISPLTYGLPLSSVWQDALFMISSWR